MTDEPRTQNRQPTRGLGRGRGPTEKAKDFKGTWIGLLKYSRSLLPIIVVGIVAAFVAAILQVIGTYLMGANLVQKITDGVIAMSYGTGWIDIHAIFDVLIILICIYVGSAVFSLIWGWIVASATQKITKRMRTDISRKINRLPFKYFNKVSYGDVLSRVTNDADILAQSSNQGISTLISQSALLICATVAMFYTNWIMSVTAIGCSLVGMVIMMFIIKKSQRFFNAQQKDLGNVNGHVEETYAGHDIIKAYNSGKIFRKDFDRINQELYESGWKSQFFSGTMFPLMQFVGNLGYVAVCIVGAALAIQSDGLGFLWVITVFMIFVRVFTQALGQLGQATSSLQRTAAACERIFEFLGEEEMADESQKVKRLNGVRGDVEFKNVKFGYNPERTVIHNFSAQVKAGEKIAIVGPTGAGKTTLVNLLMRFYELDGGEILIDGVPTTEVPREDVHDKFCMVLQDTWLFEGTIKENIIYSKPNVSDEAVIDACKTVGLHHFIMTLPDGYETVLNDKASLSEGQKQLLTIARAIIKDSPLLILDEATSSVDTRTERIVQAAMDNLTVGRTSFIIAHRLSTIRNANKILVLRDGDIVESGNHDELLARGGFYAELYNSQFEMAT